MYNTLHQKDMNFINNIHKYLKTELSNYDKCSYYQLSHKYNKLCQIKKKTTVFTQLFTQYYRLLVIVYLLQSIFEQKLLDNYW